jgi:hypothetical protein
LTEATKNGEIQAEYALLTKGMEVRLKGMLKRISLVPYHLKIANIALKELLPAAHGAAKEAARANVYRPRRLSPPVAEIESQSTSQF